MNRILLVALIAVILAGAAALALPPAESVSAASGVVTVEKKSGPGYTSPPLCCDQFTCNGHPKPVIRGALRTGPVVITPRSGK